MTDDQQDTGQELPWDHEDESLLGEVLDLVDERVSRVTDEEIEARLHLTLAKVNPANVAAHTVPSPSTETADLNPIVVNAHLEAIHIVEAARREADARRREAHYAERLYAKARDDAKRTVETAAANSEIIKAHALIIIEQARERANWILEHAQQMEEAAPREADLAAVGSPRTPKRRKPPPGAHYDTGPGWAGEGAVVDQSPRFVDDGAGAGVARRHWERRYARLLVGVDGLVGVVAALAAYAVRFPAASTGAYSYLAATVLVPVLWICTIALSGGYESRILGLGSEEFQRIFRAFVGLTATAGFVSFALKADIARGYTVLALPLAMVLSFLGHYAARKRLHRSRSRGRFTYRVIVVGGDESVADLTTQLRHERYAGMQVVGACLSSGDGARLVGLGVPLLGGLDDVVEAVRASCADTVAVAAGPDVDPARLRQLSWQLEGTDTDLMIAPGLMEVAGPRLHIRPMTGLPLLHVEEPEFAGARRVAKAIVDRSLAVLAFLLFFPLLLGCWLAVRLTSPGPAIFKQTRTGQDGKEFTLLKFRTMFVDAEQRKAELLTRNERSEGLLFKIRDDPRVTPVGRFLRRYSLDELPQLVNVVQGKMSLVGPRPPLPAEVALYQDDVRRRLLVKPGLTGLWQISGRSDLDWDESVRLDLRYVENWSFTLDLMILWKTMSTVARGRGAY